MDEDLKSKLVDKVALAQSELKVRLEGKGRKTSLPGGEKRPENALLGLVQKKLKKERLWKRVQAALVADGFNQFTRALERKQESAAVKVEISAARERQLALFPGFESLPTRIRSGRSYLKFPDATVAQFLDYATKYETRAQRDQKTADELRRLADKVKPYAETEPELAISAAFERAQFEAQREGPKLAVAPRPA